MGHSLIPERQRFNHKQGCAYFVFTKKVQNGGKLVLQVTEEESGVDLSSPHVCAHMYLSPPRTNNVDILVTDTLFLICQYSTHASGSFQMSSQINLAKKTNFPPVLFVCFSLMVYFTSSYAFWWVTQPLIDFFFFLHSPWAHQQQLEDEGTETGLEKASWLFFF